MAEWHNIYIDILIQVAPTSSGSLLRLFRSIGEADYSGFRRPHLTIELPPDIDPPTQFLVETFVWPPLDPSGGPHASQVTIRHRISRQRLDTEEASLRFVESFYSARPEHSHVLVLSPRVALSSLYYHYLIYNVLEYRHSSYSNYNTEKLMGISLDLPARHLNDSDRFYPPLRKAADTSAAGPPEEPSPAPFLWQAPNSNAALYFGDKWAEFHSFLTSRLTAQQRKFVTRPKQISPNYPSWTEYLLELMRARNYNLLYPNLPSSHSLATAHNELFQLPEESISPPQKPATDIAPPNLKEPFLLGPSPTSNPLRSDYEPPLVTTTLLTVLSDDGDLPVLTTLQLLSYSGELLTAQTAQQQAAEFGHEFKGEIGGCKTKTNQLDHLMTVNDLFCLDDDETSMEEEQSVRVVDPIKRVMNSIAMPAGKQEAVLDSRTHIESGEDRVENE